MRTIFAIATICWTALLLESLWAGWRTAVRTGTSYLSEGPVLLFIGVPTFMFALTSGAWVASAFSAKRAVHFSSDNRYRAAPIGILSLVTVLPYLIITSVL